MYCVWLSCAVFCTVVVIHRFPVNNVMGKILTPKRNSYLSDSWPDYHCFSRTLEEGAIFTLWLYMAVVAQKEHCRKWKTHVLFLDCSWYLFNIVLVTSELFVLILLMHCCMFPVLLHSRSWDQFWGNWEQVFLTDACRAWRRCLLPSSWAGGQPGTV